MNASEKRLFARLIRAGWRNEAKKYRAACATSEAAKDWGAAKAAASLITVVSSGRTSEAAQEIRVLALAACDSR
jgi:hypothetical protein